MNTKGRKNVAVVELNPSSPEFVTEGNKVMEVNRNDQAGKTNEVNMYQVSQLFVNMQVLMNQQAAMMASQQQQINQIQKNQELIFQTQMRGKTKESNFASGQKGSGQTARKGEKQTECWNCKQLGHISRECPQKSQHKPTETIQTQS